MPHEQGEKIVIYWNFKKTLTAICAILLIPTIIVFLFSATLKSTIISPNYYKKVLVKADTYNRLIEDGIPSLILNQKSADDSGANAFARQISVLLIQKFVDPDWVKDQTETLIEKIANYFKNPKAGINFDLSKSQTYLVSIQDALIFAQQMIPSCQQAQTNGTGKLLGASLDCKKTDLDKIKADLGSTQEKIGQINLGVVDLEKYIDGTNSFIEAIQNFTGKINTYFWVSLILLVVFIAIIIILELKNLAFAIRSLCLGVGIGSLISLATGVIIGSVVSKSYAGIATATLNSQISEIISDVMNNFVSGILHCYIWAGVIAIVVVVAVYATLVILEKRGLKFVKGE